MAGLLIELRDFIYLYYGTWLLRFMAHKHYFVLEDNMNGFQTIC